MRVFLIVTSSTIDIFFEITKFSKILSKLTLFSKILSKFDKIFENFRKKCQFRKYFRKFCNFEKSAMVNEVNIRLGCRNIKKTSKVPIVLSVCYLSKESEWNLKSVTKRRWSEVNPRSLSKVAERQH